MTTRMSSRLLDSDTTTQLRPRYEGSNIGTWLGFKHINYLVEEAVLDHFRDAGFPVRSLYEDYGLCFDIVELDTRILTGLHLDELVEAVVKPNPKDSETGELAFAVSLFVPRDAGRTKVAAARARVALRLDARGGPTEPIPDELLPYTTSRIARSAVDSAPVPSLPSPYALGRGAAGGDPLLAELTRGSNAFAWRWRIPYPYCHFTERLQMSGYLRQLEEVVDLFLADRGVSIKRLLDEQSWIPVVPHSSISMLDEALMEEDLYTVFTVEKIFKGFTYTARMDTYVPRDGQLLHTATGRITHGYAEIKSRSEFNLVEFDGRVLAALEGEGYAT